MWTNMWMNLFGSSDGWLGLDWGFWVALFAVCLIVIVENVIFWKMKPLPIAAFIRKQEEEDKQKEKDSQNLSVDELA